MFVKITAFCMKTATFPFFHFSTFPGPVCHISFEIMIMTLVAFFFFVLFLFFWKGVGFADSHLWRGDV